MFLILAIPVIWLLYRPKLRIFKARLGRAVQIAAVVYFVMIGLRLYTNGVDEEQMLLAGASFLLFVGVWGAAWLITRGIERTR